MTLNLTALLALLVWSLPALGESLSWSQAIALTVKNNAQLKASESSLRSAKFLENASYSGFLPQISGELGYGRSGSNNPAGDGGDKYSASLEGRENLFSGFSDAAKVKSAKANTQIAEADLRAVKASVSADLKNAYQGSVFAVEFQKLSRSIIKRRQENLRMVELRFQTGRENKGSVLLSQANLDQAKFDDLQAGNSARTALAQLAKALGLDEPVDFAVTEAVPVAPPPAAEPDLKAIAQNTPDYLKAQAQITSANSSLTGARSAFLPSLDVTGSVGRSDDEFYPEASKTWSVGISLSLPIFNGGRDYYGSRSAVALLTAANQTFYSASRELLVELQRAYATYVESVVKLQVDESFRRAATLRAEIARSKYNNGLLSFEDWDRIESDLITRQRAFLQSQRDRVSAEAAWEKAQGKGAIP